MTERILTESPCKECRRGTKRRTGTIYKEQQRNTGHRSNSGGRHCGVQYVRGVGRVVRSRWVAEISVHGKRYRFRSTSYDNCRWWIRMMVEKYENGCDVVYGVRSKRETDTFFKRFTAEAFYKILNKMGAKVIFNHADFRLMSKRALNAFAEYKETNIFLRGMVPLIGYKSDIVTYERFERLAGESKYPLKKMLALAWEGITSLSIQPIRMITGLGTIVFAISIIMIIYSLVSYFMGFAVSGWASILCSIWAIGGLQILAIGIIGEYIGKIYLEVKRRPRFIVEEFLED